MSEESLSHLMKIAIESPNNLSDEDLVDKIQKHFQNVMLVGMASKISKNYTYKCVDRSRHNGIKGAKAKLMCTLIKS